MTCTWNKIFSNNISQFKIRFPQLFDLLKPEYEYINEFFKQEDSYNENDTNILKKAFPFWDFLYSKSNHIIAKENNTFIHSAYDPIKEASRIFQSGISKDEEITQWLFAGIGLGYSPIEFSKIDKESLMIIVEPDPFYLFASMATLDWTWILNREQCVIITKCSSQQALLLTENLCNLERTKVITNNSLTNHQEEWFKTFFTLLKRNKQKQIINTNTLEKFSDLWLKNSSKNIKHFPKLNGINIYKNILNNKIPSLIVAAGPTLEETLPYLKELSKKTVVIAVDTALKFLLKNNIEPDFVILIDPQYYASCHIQGLKSKNSVLITESSVYPNVLRFECRKIVMCESLFPLGRYFEQNLLEEKTFGKINAGGSVSTSCWDFAKFIGAKEIYFAGLDLGYPKKITHVKGSTFEEKTHSSSSKLNTAESGQVSILFSSQNEKSLDYDNKQIITDSKMKLFAWWFESQIAKETQLKTYSLSKKSLKIPGVNFIKIEDVLKNPEIHSEKIQLIHSAEKNAKAISKEKFDSTLEKLLSLFQELLSKSKKGLSICNKILSEPEYIAENLAKKSFSTLTEIDNYILNSEAKTVASLVFPSERQLSELLKNHKYNSGILQNITKSKIIYTELIKSINKYLANLT